MGKQCFFSENISTAAKMLFIVLFIIFFSFFSQFLYFMFDLKLYCCTYNILQLCLPFDKCKWLILLVNAYFVCTFIILFNKKLCSCKCDSDALCCLNNVAFYVYVYHLLYRPPVVSALNHGHHQCDVFRDSDSSGFSVCDSASYTELH